MKRIDAQLARLLKDIEERLVHETPEAVRRAKRRASLVWSCALVFDSSAPPFLPPEIALTTIDERDACMKKSKALGRKQIWNCVAFDGVGVGWYEDRKLLTACDQACALLEDDALPVTRLCMRVAKRLNALPAKSFGTLEPVVVYAFDRNELPTKLLAASLTAQRRKSLERASLL